VRFRHWSDKGQGNTVKWNLKLYYIIPHIKAANIETFDIKATHLTVNSTRRHLVEMTNGFAAGDVTILDDKYMVCPVQYGYMKYNVSKYIVTSKHCIHDTDSQTCYCQRLGQRVLHAQM